MKDPSWRNWAGNQRCEPDAVAKPAGVEELTAVITTAAERGQRVKPVGAGHSFSSVALTDGLMIDTSDLSGISSIRPVVESNGSTDSPDRLVTVGGGTRLRDLNRALAALGLALENLGDIDQQTLAGALATGTHGTGARFGGLATQVEGLTLIMADGRPVSCDRDRRPDVFAAARVGLGALGVITDITLRCGPAFRLRATERPAGLAETLETFTDDVAAHDHLDFYWFPHTDRVLTKINDRTDDDRPLPRVRRLLDDEILSNGAFGVINQVGRLRPRAIPALNRLAARALSTRTYTAPSYQVFTSPRRVRFTECEYAVPRAALPDVISQLRSWLDDHDERIAFPVEIRVAAADDIWLSTGFERENAYVAVHQFHRRDHRRYFAAFEAIAAEHAGRPHWGKLHSLEAAQLRALYPRHDDFVALRDRLDPARMFGNGYLHQVLG